MEGFVRGILTGFLAVIATLRLQFAQTIAFEPEQLKKAQRSQKVDILSKEIRSDFKLSYYCSPYDFLT